MFQQKSIKHLCRDLRKNLTPAERILWERLRNRQLLGLKFLRQHPIIYKRDYKGTNFFIADFYCAELKLVIEVDGGVHKGQKEYDEQRTYLLNEMGVDVIRFENERVEKETDKVLKLISEKCTNSPLYHGREGPESYREGQRLRQAFGGRRVSRTLRASIFIILLLLLSIYTAHPWGFYAHKQINKMAVFTLPPEMIGFYKSNITYITDHAVDADKRRRKNNYEAARHYIDADKYGLHPFDSIPREWKKAIEKYTEDTLKAYGILPWHIDHMLYKLTEAFKQGNKKDILYLSANIGHYIADAHVPLHTTMNYNGQLTNQQGIHGLWESSIPELKADSFDFLTGRAVYIKKPLEAVWKTVEHSFAAKDSVLQMEASLSNKFAADQKYTFKQKGKKSERAYSPEYVEAYNKLLNGMVERRMRESIRLLGSLWYTAWVNAGQPDLKKIDEGKVENEKQEADSVQVKKLYLKGHEDE